MSEERDYRTGYKDAVKEAVAGGIGVYEDFDSTRQMSLYRLLSADRSRLLTFARREGITTGKVDTLKTLQSPKPLYQMVAAGDDDTRKVRNYLDRIA